MMVEKGRRKQIKKFYFSVEGETEKWYMEWLQNELNRDPASKYTVSIDAKVEKDPIKRIKSMNVLSKVEITHLTDFESCEEMHTVSFTKTLDSLKAASQLGKQVKYNLGYSNFTFELWMILHKIDCFGPCVHRRNYLKYINRAYNEQFENLAQFKQEKAFKRILGTLVISDVKSAIDRSKYIMGKSEEQGFILHKYKGYQYYRENPSLTIWESIEKVLNSVL